ncbi:MAG: SdpI family protein [bacterium]
MSKLITKKEIIPVLIILCVVAASAIFYSRLPVKVPSHWNARGEIDGYAGRGFTVIFFPSLILGIYLLSTFFPFIDPLKENVEKFATPYFYLRTILVLFLSSLYFYTIYAAVKGGAAMPIDMFILPALGVMFIAIGYLLPKFKKNYVVGIRTPWTLHSEEVWNLTHQRAQKWFTGAGIFLILGGFLKLGIFVLIIMAICLFYPIVDSYFIYRKVNKK